MNTNTMNTATSSSVQSNTTGTMAGATHDMKIDDRAIKKMAGDAITKVDGVLGVEGNLTDMLKPSDDLTKGLAVTLSEDGTSVQIGVKLITEFGKNIPSIVDKVQGDVQKTLRELAGLRVEKVEVEVTDTMTREEYQAKTSKTAGDAQNH